MMAPGVNQQVERIALGGCGAQIGMLAGCAVLVSGMFMCAMFAFTSVLTMVIVTQQQPVAETQAALPQPEEVPVLAIDPIPEASAPSLEDETVAETIEELLEEGIELEGLELDEENNEAIIVVPGGEEAAIGLGSTTAVAFAFDGQVNLRCGPGTEFKRSGVLPDRQQLEIVGRNDDSSWWLVSAENGLAWVADDVVDVRNATAERIPIVEQPVPLFGDTATLPAPEIPAPGTVASDEPAVAVDETAPTTDVEGLAQSEEQLPEPTPTAELETFSGERTFVQDVKGYKQLWRTLLLPPVSEAFHPTEDQIAISEGIKLYLVATDGSFNRVLVESDETINSIREVVWSPNGDYLAFTVDHQEYCTRTACRTVGLVYVEDGTVFYLDPPSSSVIEAPRWTRDGTLLVNSHPGEPASGATYEYDPLSGEGVEADGGYILASSHDAQKYSPWLPGRFWQAGVAERPDNYYND